MAYNGILVKLAFVEHKLHVISVNVAKVACNNFYYIFKRLGMLHHSCQKAASWSGAQKCCTCQFVWFSFVRPELLCNNLKKKEKGGWAGAAAGGRQFKKKPK